MANISFTLISSEPELLSIQAIHQSKELGRLKALHFIAKKEAPTKLNSPIISRQSAFRIRLEKTKRKQEGELSGTLKHIVSTPNYSKRTLLTLFREHPEQEFNSMDLYHALEDQNEQIVLNLIDIRPSLAYMPLDKQENTALMLAVSVESSSDQLLKGLIERSDINQKNIWGENALEKALLNGNAQTITALFENGSQLPENTYGQGLLFQQHTEKLFEYITSVILLHRQFTDDEKEYARRTNSELLFKKSRMPVTKHMVTDREQHADMIKILDTQQDLLSSFLVDQATANNLVATLNVLPKEFRILSRLKALQLYLSQSVEAFSSFAESSTCCPICQEDYSTNNRLIICSNGNHVCRSCFNNPSLNTCPLCREDFAFNKYQACQSCLSNNQSTRFAFCIECKHMNVICRDCIHFPCCKKPLPANQNWWKTLNEIEIHAFLTAFTQTIMEKVAHEKTKQERTTVELIETAKAAFQEKIDPIVSQLATIKEQLENYQQSILSKQRQIRDKERALFGPKEDEINDLIKAHNNLVDHHNRLHKLGMRLTDTLKHHQDTTNKEIATLVKQNQEFTFQLITQYNQLLKQVQIMGNQQVLIQLK